jgi:hypothetical protein
MTEAIAKGDMTRAQRQARVQQILQEIDRIEIANRLSTTLIAWRWRCDRTCCGGRSVRFCVDAASTEMRIAAR